MIDSNDTYVKVTEDGVLQFLGKSPLAPLEDTSSVELGSPLSFNGGGGEGGFEPTEEQLAAMNSGITATKVATYDALPDDEDVKDIIEDHFVAGSNITITSNQDGTQTIASTASSGVPTITSEDNGKFLRANYYNATSTSDCSWENLSSTAVVNALSTAQQDAINSGITSTKVGQYDNRVSHVLDGKYTIPSGFTDHIYYGSTSALNPESFVLMTTTGTTQTFGQQISAAIGGSHKLYFKFKPYGSSAVWTDWIKLDIDALSNYTPAPTTYTSATTGANVTDVSGGYVVSNNICTVNICCNFSSPTSGDVLFSNLPKPALQPGSTDATISTVLLLGSTSNASTGKTGAHVYLTQGGTIIASDEDYSGLGSNSKIITGSYLIDTST